MFMDTIKKMASKSLKQKLLPLCEKYEIVGTYAQTELGHGMISVLRSGLISVLAE